MPWALFLHGEEAVEIGIGWPGAQLWLSTPLMCDCAGAFRFAQEAARADGSDYVRRCLLVVFCRVCGKADVMDRLRGEWHWNGFSVDLFAKLWACSLVRSCRAAGMIFGLPVELIDHRIFRLWVCKASFSNIQWCIICLNRPWSVCTLVVSAVNFVM